MSSDEFNRHFGSLPTDGEGVAVGERHPAQQWKPSVYEIAHRRLNR